MFEMNSAGVPQFCCVVVFCVEHVHASTWSPVLCTPKYPTACGGLRFILRIGGGSPQLFARWQRTIRPLPGCVTDEGVRDEQSSPLMHTYLYPPYCKIHLQQSLNIFRM
jgi:hypothetical protein